MLKRLCLAFGLSVLSAPSMAKDAELPMPLAEQLPVEIQLTQHEMAVDVQDYSSGMLLQYGIVGALIGSMVENSQTKKGEEAILPVRNLLVNYDFQQRLVNQLQAGLEGSGVATHPVVSVSNLPWEGRDDLHAMPARALVIRPRYALDETMGTLYLRLQVSLEDREARNGSVRSKVVFARPYTFRSTLAASVPGDTTVWTGLGAERISQLMDQSVDQTVALLRYDFSAEGRQRWSQKVKGTTQVAGRYVPGRVERNSGDAVWVRAGNKRSQNLIAYQTLRPGQAPAVAVPTGAATTTSGSAGRWPAPHDAGDPGSRPAAGATADFAVVQNAPATPTPALQTAAVQQTAPLAPVPAPASRSTFWEQYRPKEPATAPATTP